MLNHKKLGAIGEDLALQYLKKKGYTIIERNFRRNFGEIDLIAQHKREKNLVFFEVKTKTQDAFGQPQEAVDFFKQRKLLRTAYAYCEQKNIPLDFQIDVIAITMDYQTGKAKIKHFKNVVEERWWNIIFNLPIFNQAPNSNFQTKIKNYLGFGAWNFIGIWDLKIENLYLSLLLLITCYTHNWRLSLLAFLFREGYFSKLLLSLFKL